MKLAGVIFDLDGTLGDTLPVCFAAFRRALRKFSDRRYTDDEIAALFGPSEEGIIQQLVPDHWQACLDTYLAAYEEESARRARLFPGIETALRLLSERGVVLAIATGKGAHSAAISLRHLNLAKHFDVVETGSPEGGVKPGSIRKILGKWGAPPHEVAYVGDAPSDIEAAVEAGVIPLAAAWATTSSAEGLGALGPLETFRSVGSFIAWIDANVGPNRS
ncbi:MAG: HAD family hydrolase [candidate division NC10 bacterium]|nr:HAD family hydrolase [candidate division NC10 bacterium]